jgi:hypothetical protein
MKNTIYLHFIVLLLAAFFTSHSIAQPVHTIMQGKKGDICYEAEVAYRNQTWGTTEMIVAKDDYLDCLARQYTSGQANLYEVRMRVNNGEIGDLLMAIGDLYCDNSSDPDCSMKHANFLLHLDSDQDGLEDLNDPTPDGNNPPPKLPPGDEDGDGVSDDIDECADSPPGWNVNPKGCPQLILQAQSNKSFYELGTETVIITGKVIAPDGATPLEDATVSFVYDNIKYIDPSERDGSFEIKFEPQPEPKNYHLQLQAVSGNYREIKPNTTSVTFSTRPGLSVSFTTDKAEYLAGETIHISGKVESPEPIGSDLDIWCEIRVFDAFQANPYRIQRVHLRSDGSFSYEVPIYGPEAPGKWLEAGEYGQWTLVAEVGKGNQTYAHMELIDVYRHQVDQNKALREYWARKHEAKRVKTANAPQTFDRPSHGESVVLGPNSNVIFTQTEQMENEIKVLDGAILYLKKMRQKLSDAKPEVLLGNPDAYITIEGLFAKCTSINSAYILEADPASGIDKITVFHGPIAIASPEGKFPTFQVESGTEVSINAGGIQNQRSLPKKDQWVAGQPFVNTLGGVNPADLRHESDPYAEELDPYANYQPDLEDILQDYGLYILLGVLGLVVLIVSFRRRGKAKPKVREPASRTKKAAPEAPKTASSDSEWEDTRFCSNCGNVMPMSSKFCPSCGAKQ